jgi:hypothetical protein
MLQQLDTDKFCFDNENRERKEEHQKNPMHGRRHYQPCLDMERTINVQNITNYLIGQHQKNNQTKK